MLKRLFTEVRVPVMIENRGPLLVKSGLDSISGPDMTPVKVWRNNHEEVYLPGSSLKGALRSHFERVARTLAGSERTVVCDPFKKYASREPDASCGDYFQQMKKKIPLSNAIVYDQSCPACRLFGSTWFIGRVAINDAYLQAGCSSRLERRDGVGIDRLTGGSSRGAKFDLETVGAGARFQTEIVIRNFECWQLGALFMLLDDLQDGLIRLGSGKSRGLGDVTCAYEQVDLYRIGEVAPSTEYQVPGLGYYLGNEEYGTRRDDTLELGDEMMPKGIKRGIRVWWAFRERQLKGLHDLALDDFSARMSKWPELTAKRGNQND